MFLLYHLAYYNLFSPKKQLYVFIFHKHVFYLQLFLKRKLHIKVIEVIPLIVFFFPFVYPGVSPLLFIYFILFHSFYHLF